MRPLQELHETSCTIAAGQNLSGVVDLKRQTLVELFLPGTWTAAVITFQVSMDGTTFGDLWDESGEVTLLAPAASRRVLIEGRRLVGLRYFKVRSGQAAAPVNQAQDATITLAKRGL